jgi:Flp pilus assembly protein TadB
MSLDALHPDDRKRVLAGLQKDKRYAKSRNMFLLVSLVVAICLSMVGWMVMKDLVTFLGVIIVLCVCLVAYSYSAYRVVKIRKATLARWMAQVAVKIDKKKGKKKGR